MVLSTIALIPTLRVGTSNSDAPRPQQGGDAERRNPAFPRGAWERVLNPESEHAANFGGTRDSGSDGSGGALE